MQRQLQVPVQGLRGNNGCSSCRCRQRSLSCSTAAVGSGATQAAPMQASGSAAAKGGSVLPFGHTSWLLLLCPSGCLGASAAWQTLVALLRFARAARSAVLRSRWEHALAAGFWLTTTERRANQNLLLGLPRAMHGVLDTRNCKITRAWGDAVDSIPKQQAEVKICQSRARTILDS